MKKGTDLVVLNIKHPDEALFKKSEGALEAARYWKITSPETAVEVGDQIKAVKALAREVNAKRLAITKPLNDALREVNSLFAPAKDWLMEAERILKNTLLDYQNEQERIARELQAKADAEARKEREKLERKAAKAEAKGKEDKADELREQAETQIAPKVTSAAPKLAGISRRETWRAEVTEKQALLVHITTLRPDLLPLVKIDQSALNGMARVLKGELSLPGVKVSKEASIAARG